MTMMMMMMTMMTVMMMMMMIKTWRAVAKQCEQSRYEEKNQRDKTKQANISDHHYDDEDNDDEG